MRVIKKELVVMNAQKARKLLERNFNNRELHANNVEYFVNIIKNGEWQALKTNSIQVDADGNLINGQHRLNAIVQADAEIPVWIFTVEL